MAHKLVELFKNESAEKPSQDDIQQHWRKKLVDRRNEIEKKRRDETVKNWQAFGMAARDLRQKYNLSRGDAAATMGISCSVLRQIENGTYNYVPTIKVVAEFIEMYGDEIVRFVKIGPYHINIVRPSDDEDELEK